MTRERAACSVLHHTLRPTRLELGYNCCCCCRSWPGSDDDDDGEAGCHGSAHNGAAACSWRSCAARVIRSKSARTANNCSMHNFQHVCCLTTRLYRMIFTLLSFISFQQIQQRRQCLIDQFRPLVDTAL